MRLELEPNVSSVEFAEGMTNPSVTEDRTEEAAEHLRAGIRYAQSGNRAAARASLLRAAQIDPRSESAWLWLSSISEYPEELLAFLTNVLDINPSNARALEWSAATRSLLAKNFVQRGIDAVESNQQEIAFQHFNQALEYDEKNAMAWLWLASLSDSNEGKLSYLEKVLEFDPANESARTAYTAARNGIRTKLLAEARAAAVAGNASSANELLDAIIAEEPDAEDAWVLRSHIAEGFDSKVAAFRRILEINPDNAGAKAGLESITAIMDAVLLDQPAAEPVAEQETSAGSESTEEQWVNNEVASTEAETSVQQDLAPDGADGVPEWAGNEIITNTEEASYEEGASYNEESESSPSPEVLESPFTVSEAFADFSEEPAKIVSEETFAEPVEIAPETEPETDENVGVEAAFEPTSENADVQPVTEEIVYDPVPEDQDFEHTVFGAPFAREEKFAGINVVEEPEAVETDETIAPPTGSNPFESEAFGSGSDEFKTILSSDLDEDAQAALQSFRESFPPAFQQGNDGVFDVPFDATMFGGIPRPTGEFTEEEYVAERTGFETTVATGSRDERPLPQTMACPFCEFDNDVQAIACQNCMAVLTLADLELVLANHHADKNVLRLAVERMEEGLAAGEPSEAALTTLGIGHLNLRNLDLGYKYLAEASQKNPNNVMLSGQVHTLLIRLDEIRRQDEAHEGMSRGKKIMVVDDSPTVRKLIAGKLEKCGHEVFCSADGVEAIAQLESLKPDLVLLDITMPRMDGYQVCKVIRNSEETKDVPVVMISGKDGFFDKVRGRMAGTTGYITKPFGPETLMKAVESYLRTEAQ